MKQIYGILEDNAISPYRADQSNFERALLRYGIKLRPGHVTPVPVEVLREILESGTLDAYEVGAVEDLIDATLSMGTSTAMVFVY